jgi:hypothetical protein
MKCFCRECKYNLLITITKVTRANHVTETDAERDCKVEESQDPGTHILDKQVAYQGRSNRRIRGLTDADLEK